VTLEQLLTQKRALVLKRWFDLILETYPEDTTGFLKQEKDRFLNPVGYTTYEDISALYDRLCQGEGIEKIANSIEDTIRIRAVQDFSPSKAIIFIFLLKKAVRELSGNELDTREFIRFDSVMDELALQAFDIYTKCREEIHDIRVKEIKEQEQRALRLMQRMNIV